MNICKLGDTKSFITIGPGSKVVEHLTQNTEVEGSNPTTSIGKRENGKKVKKCAWGQVTHLTYNPETGRKQMVNKVKCSWLCPGKMVEQLTQNPQVEGSNPTTDTGERENGEKSFTFSSKVESPKFLS
jgi:hypothetical protein